MRSIWSVFFCLFTYRVGIALIHEPSLYTLLLFITEAMTFFLMIFSKFSKEINSKPYPLLITTFATFNAIFLEFNDGLSLLPRFALVLSVIQIIGIIIQILSKISLGKSFDILPANKEIKISGLYSVIRHPMYLGYSINYLGFILNCFSIKNITIVLTIITLLVLRIYQEEKVLKKDPLYQNYMSKVTYRLIPGLF